MISVYMEDLYSSYFDFDNIQDVDTLLAEGTWEFDVKLTQGKLNCSQNPSLQKLVWAL